MGPRSAAGEAKQPSGSIIGRSNAHGRRFPEAFREECKTSQWNLAIWLIRNQGQNVAVARGASTERKPTTRGRIAPRPRRPTDAAADLTNGHPPRYQGPVSGPGPTEASPTDRRASRSRPGPRGIPTKAAPPAPDFGPKRRRLHPMPNRHPVPARSAAFAFGLAHQRSPQGRRIPGFLDIEEKDSALKGLIQISQIILFVKLNYLSSARTPQVYPRSTIVAPRRCLF